MNPDKLRFAGTPEHVHFQADDKCHCPCFCDPTVARGFEQSAMRYNDRSSYANNNQQDNQTLLLSMFQAQAQNSLEQTPTTDLVALLAQLIALSQAQS